MALRKFDRVSLTPAVDAIAATLGWRAQRRVAEGLAEMVQTLRAAANVAA